MRSIPTTVWMMLYPYYDDMSRDNALSGYITRPILEPEQHTIALLKDTQRYWSAGFPDYEEPCLPAQALGTVDITPPNNTAPPRLQGPLVGDLIICEDHVFEVLNIPDALLPPNNDPVFWDTRDVTHRYLEELGYSLEDIDEDEFALERFEIIARTWYRTATSRIDRMLNLTPPHLRKNHPQPHYPKVGDIVRLRCDATDKLMRLTSVPTNRRS